MFQPFSLNLRGKLVEFSRPQVMGILNVTPDSFYADSRTEKVSEITSRVEEMASQGVDIFDVGGYSSRPGAENISVEEEWSRVESGLSVIRDLYPEAIISVDTFRSEIAKRAVKEYRADIINDISGGTLDLDMWDTVAALKVPYILMHMRGTPETMQSLTDYNDVTADVIKDLSIKIKELRLKGVSDIIVDPGFGFSKTVEQNYALMRNITLFEKCLEAPVLVGISRKSMITKPLGINPEDALTATTALNAIALSRGAAIIRVHDVRDAVEAVKIYQLSTLS